LASDPTGRDAAAIRVASRQELRRTAYQLSRAPMELRRRRAPGEYCVARARYARATASGRTRASCRRRTWVVRSSWGEWLVMMDEELVRGKLLGALNAAKQKQTWTRVLELPDALDELDRWLKDDRQWSAQTRGRHWITLIDGVVAALEALGESVGAVLDAEARVRDLNDGKDPLNADKDVALHRRLSRAAGELAERACSVAALAAAWDDLEAAATTGSTDVERAARCLVSIAEWIGHGADAFVDRQLAFARYTNPRSKTGGLKS
jgi:hypothetical protein